jgi:hypothetical protein
MAPAYEAIARDAALEGKAQFFTVYEENVPAGALDAYALKAYPSFLLFVSGREVARVRCGADDQRSGLTDARARVGGPPPPCAPTALFSRPLHAPLRTRSRTLHLPLARAARGRQ